MLSLTPTTIIITPITPIIIILTGVIKHDLDWVVTGWDSNTCDLWEEVQSTDFFWNRVTVS